MRQQTFISFRNFSKLNLSFTACAATKNKPLVEKNDILTIVPKIDDRLEKILEYSDSVVLMKASRNTSELESIIKNKNRHKKIYSIQNYTRENEKIIEGFSHEKPYLRLSCFF